MTGERIAAALIGAGAALAIFACGGRDGALEETVTVRVIDSAYAQSWEALEDSGTLYRIEVISPLGADTLANVIQPFPIIVEDTLVMGLLQVSEDSSSPQRKIFRLRLGAHVVETFPIPRDVWSPFQDLVVSPDGRYIAYVADDATAAASGTYALVRELATGAIVVRGPGGGGCDCDVDSNRARWIEPDSFEIAVTHSSTNAGWQLVSGRASARRMHVDTLSREPDWTQ